MEFKSRYFDCECMSREHNIRMVLDPTPGEPILYLEPSLNIYQPWYRRICIAIRFIFSIETKGNFDTWIMRDSDLMDIKDLLNEYEESKSATE